MPEMNFLLSLMKAYKGIWTLLKNEQQCSKFSFLQELTKLAVVDRFKKKTIFSYFFYEFEHEIRNCRSF